MDQTDKRRPLSDGFGRKDCKQHGLGVEAYIIDHSDGTQSLRCRQCSLERRKGK